MKKNKKIPENNIKKYRIYHGMRQVDVVNKLSISISTYRNIENNVVKPKYQTIQELCKLFNVSAKQLINEKDIR